MAEDPSPRSKKGDPFLALSAEVLSDVAAVQLPNL
jgi:hypothetical protein